MTEMENSIEAYERGDYATAFELSLPLAEQGDSHAQYNIGFMYDEGQGVPQDDARAVNWYHKAAEQGHTGAQCDLGHSSATRPLSLASEKRECQLQRGTRLFVVDIELQQCPWL